MTHLVSTLQERLQPSFLVLLGVVMLIALVTLSQTAFASQGQEKAEVSPWSLVPGPWSLGKEQGTRDEGHRTNDQTAFTYQGQLKDASGPVNGAYDLQFILYSAQTGGEQLGSIDMEDLALTNGLFNVRLDFGRTVFEAKEGWLEIGVRPGGSSEPYTVLFPRQKLTPTPYAIFAQHEQWSLIGVPVGFVGDNGKDTDIISVDEKKVSAADVEASLAKLDEKAVSFPKPDDGAVTTAAMNPAVCGGPFDCPNDHGVVGIAHVAGKAGVYGRNDAAGGAGVWGDGGNQSTGVFGSSNSATFGEAGVSGRSDKANTFGTRGWSTNGIGVWGHSDNNTGVYGDSSRNGVHGRSNSANDSGVWGENIGSGFGVAGSTVSGYAGVFGSGGGYGVYGLTRNPTADNVAGVYGKNDGIGIGVFGQNKSTRSAAVLGRNDGGGDGVVGFSLGRGRGSGVYGFTDSPDGFGGFFTNTAGGIALRVDGTASTKVLQITGGGDLAEPFEITAAHSIQPGMVVAIDPDRPGRLRITDKAYDRTVAGIISGANGINPGLTMRQEGTVADGAHPVALTGRVYCWVDASNGPIEPGDLLTTSATLGHAMKVTDHAKAQGAIIGKAMTGLERGKGLVLVLVTLQ